MLSRSFNLTAYNKIKSFKKVVEVDPDKSISIRSFLIGAISHNISSVKNVLESEDVFSTIKCLKSLGVQIKKQINNRSSNKTGIRSSNKTIKK